MNGCAEPWQCLGLLRSTGSTTSRVSHADREAKARAAARWCADLLLSFTIPQEAARDKVLGTKRDFEIHRTEAKAFVALVALGLMQCKSYQKGAHKERGARPGLEGVGNSDALSYRHRDA